MVRIKANSAIKLTKNGMVMLARSMDGIAMDVTSQNWALIGWHQLTRALHFLLSFMWCQVKMLLAPCKGWIFALINKEFRSWPPGPLWLQAAGLQQLEQESEVAGEQLRQTVKQGEQLLASLQAALTNIHTSQLEMQKIAADEFIEAYTGANTL